MDNILLTGGSGKLGKTIINSKLFKNIIAPSHDEFDITRPETISEFFKKQKSHNNNPDGAFHTIIHCAALARMIKCESSPVETLTINMLGTANLVNEIHKLGRPVRFIHISTDYVYEGITGNYKETDPTIPINTYGWSKLGAEAAVKTIKDHCIIRTSFFDEKEFPFNDAPIDQFSSRMPISDFVKAIHLLSKNRFIGTINVGAKRDSNYGHISKFIKLNKTTFGQILKDAKIPLTRDSSLDISLWNKIKDEG